MTGWPVAHSSVFLDAQAFDLLHSAAHGNWNDGRRIERIIAKAESIKQQKIAAQRDIAEATPAKIPPKKDLKKQEALRQQSLTDRRHPDATSILARPHPVVSGKRRVPSLVSARGIPFLRIKKPQPKNLSGVIRSKLANRWGWIERRARLEAEVLFAEDEDYWDELTGFQDDSQWVTAVEEALQTVNGRIRDSDKKNRELADKMWQIVLAERELAAKEQQEEGQKRLEELTDDRQGGPEAVDSPNPTKDRIHESELQRQEPSKEQWKGFLAASHLEEMAKERKGEAEETEGKEGEEGKEGKEGKETTSEP